MAFVPSVAANQRLSSQRSSTTQLMTFYDCREEKKTTKVDKQISSSDHKRASDEICPMSVQLGCLVLFLEDAAICTATKYLIPNF